MNELTDHEPSPQTMRRRTLSEEERRLALEKRIKELRKRKRRERRGSKGSNRRLLPVILILIFFLLCLFSSLFTLWNSGDAQSYLQDTIPASNLAEIEALLDTTQQVVEPSISAVAAFLLDPDTDDILYEKNADQPLAMASTTKIMTAVVTLENASLQDPVTISENASAVGESSAWLEKGETLTVEQLLYALLVQSANDAAVALAEYVGGSVEAFVEMMNEKAIDIGADNTHFSNPHGLDQEGHYTTARDLSLIAEYAMEIPLFREIVRSSGYEIPWPGHPFPRVLENHNKLLEMYPYATGIKTGYTLDAGKCLVASAEREGRELISVILNGGDSYWDQTIQLMEYGFNSFTRVDFAYSSQPLATVEVGDFPRHRVNAVPLGNLAFTVRLDHLEAFKNATIYYHEWLPYSVSSGQEVGYIVAAEDSPYQKMGDLVSDTDCNPPNILLRFLAFIAAVFAFWWRGLKWLIPGL